VAKLTDVTWDTLIRKLEAHSMPLKSVRSMYQYQVQEDEHSLEYLRIL
jgi:hypothetical protein